MATASASGTTEKTQVFARALTLEEINDMMQSLPSVQSAVQTAGKFTRRKLISRLRDSLKLFRIVPSQIPALKDAINRKFIQAVMPIGQPIGMTAVEAIIQPIQQMALNSFHSSGSAKNVAVGIGQISSIISASANPKVRSVSVHFTNRTFTLEEVLAKRKYFVGITVREFITDILIDEPAIILNNRPPWWYYSFKRARDLQEPNMMYTFPIAARMMRMTLDTNKMYTHEVTAQDICEKLEDSAPVTCIWSPLLRVNISGEYVVQQYIHVYPIETRIQLDKLNIESEALSNIGYIDNIFFELSLIPGMQSIYVKGIEGIEALYPVERPVWSIVGNEQQIAPEQLPPVAKNDFTYIEPITPPTGVNVIPYSGNRYWYLSLSNQRQRMSGIPASRIAELCTYLGMTVIDYSEEKDIKYVRSSLHGIDDEIIERQSYLIVEMPEFLPANISNATRDRDKYAPTVDNDVNSSKEVDIITTNVKPSELMQYYLKLDNEQEGAYVMEQVKEILRLNKLAYEKKNQASDESLPDVERARLLREASDALTESRSKVPARPTANSKTHQMMTYVYADTIGTNLRAILLRDDVDTSHTYSSNMYEILEAFGIEAVRSFLIKTINDAVKFEGYINPASIILLADFMTHTGFLTKITFKGLKEQSTSFVSQAALEQAMTVMAGAAAFGRREKTTPISAAIAVGRPIPIGTGAGREIDADLRKQIEADLRALDTGANAPQVDATALSAALHDINTSLVDVDIPDGYADVTEFHYDGRGEDYDGAVALGEDDIGIVGLPTAPPGARIYKPDMVTAVPQPGLGMGVPGMRTPGLGMGTPGLGLSTRGLPPSPGMSTPGLGLLPPTGLSTPGLGTPGLGLPTGLRTPGLPQSPGLRTPGLPQSPGLRTPGLQRPTGLGTPGLPQSPGLRTPGLQRPTGLGTPGLQRPIGLGTPGLQRPTVLGTPGLQRPTGLPQSPGLGTPGLPPLPSSTVSLPFSTTRHQEQQFTPGVTSAPRAQPVIPAPNAGAGLRAVASTLASTPIYAEPQEIADVVTVTSVPSEGTPSQFVTQQSTTILRSLNQS